MGISAWNIALAVTAIVLALLILASDLPRGRVSSGLIIPSDMTVSTRLRL